MVICDLFELQVSVTNNGTVPVLEYVFYTDLPPGTLVGLSCQRTYLNRRDATSIWIGYNERLVVQPSIFGDYAGGKSCTDGVESDKKVRELFKEINSGVSSGIKSAVSNALTTLLTVGARQRLRDFGNHNNALRGPMVQNKGGINTVEVSETVLVPTREDLQPIGSD